MHISIWIGRFFWDAAIDDIPGLRRQALNILTTEFPETESD